MIFSPFKNIVVIPALFMFLTTSGINALTEQEYSVKDNYDKTEVMITMRDGTKLFTAYLVPKDHSKTYPILLYRTPYSIGLYGDDFPTINQLGPAPEFVKDGYIFVYQDIRGTFKSEGTFEVIRSIRKDKNNPVAIDESTDNYDTIEWLLNNIDGHNGKVGQWGISYSAWTTVMGMIDPHPALAASSPQASPSDMFKGDDWHHNGAFRLMYAFNWMGFAAQQRDELTTEKFEKFDYGTPWGYAFFLKAGSTSKLNEKYFKGRIPAWNDFINHPDYDNYWQTKNVLPHLKNITHPVLNVAGWFDAEDFYGPLSIYQEIEKNSAHNKSTLVVGPWMHGGWSWSDGSSLGDIEFGSQTTDFYKKHIVFPFFQYYLKGSGKWTEAEAIVFETGNNRWRKFEQWPPKGVELKNLYFHANGKLSFKAPIQELVRSHDTYISNPNNPVPFSNEITTHTGHTWMIEDQRLTSTRPDVITYKTDILDEDISIAGSLLANLFISTTGTDADYFVKLIDVFPQDSSPTQKDIPMGGYQMLLAVEVMRAKYRSSMSKPTPLVPNKVTPLSFRLWDKFHTFKKGHQIMVQIHSSWFPAYDRNPQQFINIYTAEAKDYFISSHNIYYSNQYPSHIQLPIFEQHNDHQRLE